MSKIVSLPSSGSIPGIPGDHAPGIYEVDYGERTIKLVVLEPPVQDAVSESVEQTALND